jgi:anaphase-promoting complex subunit 8
LAGERQKEQERAEATHGTINNASHHPSTTSQQQIPPKQIGNHQLRTLHAELRNIEKDAFLLYLYGVILKESGNKQQALDIFLESVTLQPLLWCSWLEIVRLMIHLVQEIPQPEKDSTKYSHQQMLQMIQSKLKPHWINEIFFSHLHIEILSSQGGSMSLNSAGNQNALQVLSHLQGGLLPNSRYISAQLAMLYYHMQDYENAQNYFVHIREQDPYRIEYMDTYSNILYVKEKRPELSLLAREFHRIEKYRPETCCIIGNYYSLREEREKAVIYFQRALKIDPTYLSAWTLMGHEYIEMRNTTAAVNAYRSAVDIDPRDYRAWYGLGQTYEVLSMPHYALYYYSKSCTLRPYDGRMWCALAGCYEQLEQHRDALRCYQRARENGEKESALLKMAELFRKIGQQSRAVELYLECLKEHNESVENAKLNLEFAGRILKEEQEADALLYIAKYYQKELRPPNFEKAKQYCMQLVERFSGTYQAQAMQLLKEMNTSSIFGNVPTFSKPTTGGALSFLQ